MWRTKACASALDLGRMRPVPMAQTGSYAITVSCSSFGFKPARLPRNWIDNIFQRSLCRAARAFLRCKQSGATAAACAARTFRSRFRRSRQTICGVAVSEHDVMHKQSRKARADLAGKWPVLLPIHVLRADLDVCALPSASVTFAIAVNGGIITTSTSVISPMSRRRNDSTNRADSACVMFIFQLAAYDFLRMDLIPGYRLRTENR